MCRFKDYHLFILFSVHLFSSLHTSLGFLFIFINTVGFDQYFDEFQRLNSGTKKWLPSSCNLAHILNTDFGLHGLF